MKIKIKKCKKVLTCNDRHANIYFVAAEKNKSSKRKESNKKMFGKIKKVEKSA